MGYFSILFVVFVLFHVSICQQCDEPSDSARFDCYPESGASSDKCHARGCCWKNPSDHLQDVNVPYCFYPKDFPSYSLRENQPTDFGQRIRINKSQESFMPNDTQELTVDLIFETNQRFRIRIYQSTEERYQVPIPVPVVQTKANMTDYDVKVNENPFYIVVTRISTGVVL